MIKSVSTKDLTSDVCKLLQNKLWNSISMGYEYYIKRINNQIFMVLLTKNNNTIRKVYISDTEENAKTFVKSLITQIEESIAKKLSKNNQIFFDKQLGKKFLYANDSFKQLALFINNPNNPPASKKPVRDRYVENLKYLYERVLDLNTSFAINEEEKSSVIKLIKTLIGENWKKTLTNGLTGKLDRIKIAAERTSDIEL